MGRGRLLAACAVLAAVAVLFASTGVVAALAGGSWWQRGAGVGAVVMVVGSAWALLGPRDRSARLGLEQAVAGGAWVLVVPRRPWHRVAVVAGALGAAVATAGFGAHELFVEGLDGDEPRGPANLVLLAPVVTVGAAWLTVAALRGRPRLTLGAGRVEVAGLFAPLVIEHRDVVRWLPGREPRSSVQVELRATRRRDTHRVLGAASCAWDGRQLVEVLRWVDAHEREMRVLGPGAAPDDRDALAETLEAIAHRVVRG
ncbi:hypothetical protein [Nocardioides perillae]|uniref:PH domain-containing protein n=1 Tax=Nocardioides perillae TaxID=1119534 RepID=A0A7Y9RV31_9ACTN|nr:hypothetical protein [Nocardioides perillae]NYG55413.1 hypothetical protein [Nocardioides perillae]